MEALIRDGLIAGVLDITTTELADELVGGVLTAGPDRLTAAALRGVPQVISLGALDMVNFGPPETVPGEVQGPAVLPAQPDRDADADDAGGERPARQGDRREGDAARGPTAVLVPLRGVSAIDAEGKPFWWPEADRRCSRACATGSGRR